MSAQIVFLTLFLGVVGGSQPVALQVSGPVRMVRMMLGSREVAVLTQPPWRATVDLGTELTPRQLAAIGFDAHGNEIARATQILNLPRPIAEFDIAMEHSGGETPTGLTLRWRHLMGIRPERAKATLDDKPLLLDRNLHATLPKLDLATPHVIAAEIRFGDGFVARRELVIEATLSDSVATQLTPIPVRETATQHPSSWDGCLVRPDGTPVRTAAVETPRAVVTVVREPEAREAFNFLAREGPSFGPDTVQRMIWPVGQHYDNGDNPGSMLFTLSGESDAQRVNFPRFLSIRGPVTTDDEPLYFADAVAAAGIRAATGGQRRVVIFILSRKTDSSTLDPGAVRRYLASIGVPLFVWSPTAAPPRSAAAWGDHEDVSSMVRLGEAVQRVRHALEEQRIAWVNVDPLTALLLKANESCGIATAATPSESRASAR